MCVWVRGKSSFVNFLSGQICFSCLRTRDTSGPEHCHPVRLKTQLKVITKCSRVGWWLHSNRPATFLFTFISTKTIYTRGGWRYNLKQRRKGRDGNNRPCLEATEQQVDARGVDVRGDGCGPSFVFVSDPPEEAERRHQQARAEKIAKGRQVGDGWRVGIDLEPP